MKLIKLRMDEAELGNTLVACATSKAEYRSIIAQAGISDILVKPLTRDGLLDLVRKAQS